LLADYEEGTWTPNLGGSTTYSVQVGYYTKVGRQVTVQGVLQVDALNTPTNAGIIQGLPFTSNSATNFYQTASVGYWDQVNTPVSFIAGYINPNTSTIYLTNAITATATTGAPFAAFKSGTLIMFSATYFV
jgi:hypothetical protein